MVSVVSTKQKQLKLTYPIDHMRDTIISDGIGRSNLYTIDKVLSILDGDSKLITCERSIRVAILEKWKVSSKPGDDVIQ